MGHMDHEPGRGWHRLLAKVRKRVELSGIGLVFWWLDFISGRFTARANTSHGPRGLHRRYVCLHLSSTSPHPSTNIARFSRRDYEAAKRTSHLRAASNSHTLRLQLFRALSLDRPLQPRLSFSSNWVPQPPSCAVSQSVTLEYHLTNFQEARRQERLESRCEELHHDLFIQHQPRRWIVIAFPGTVRRPNRHLKMEDYCGTSSEAKTKTTSAILREPRETICWKW
ncbi:hypothetical protein IWX90DRAFT_308112 [Phyllosticta citrichinensis]|uniref:Uncharacterized protein n=1 Tax=Phyllosticta citrichinensis TaxID=1130410 RepID=A0ABR1XM23_9PEZI